MSASIPFLDSQGCMGLSASFMVGKRVVQCLSPGAPYLRQCQSHQPSKDDESPLPLQPKIVLKTSDLAMSLLNAAKS